MAWGDKIMMKAYRSQIEWKAVSNVQDFAELQNGQHSICKRKMGEGGEHSDERGGLGGNR